MTQPECRHGLNRVLAPFLFLAILTLTLAPPLSSQEAVDPKARNGLRFRGIAESGFLTVLSHQVQFGKEGTDFDYVEAGGQDVLFPVSRFSLEAEAGRHTLILLYQPLVLESEEILRDDAVFDGLAFPQSTGIRSSYGFPFYRASYLYQLFPENPRTDLALGGTLQIRNATIVFESTDGSRLRRNSGVGLVPALKMRGRTRFHERFFAEVEADGIYAPVSYLNGSDTEIVGAILDAAARIGAEVREPASLFMGVRYLGGGATGTSEDDDGPGDGYVKNWLHIMFFTVGLDYAF